MRRRPSPLKRHRVSRTVRGGWGGGWFPFSKTTPSTLPRTPPKNEGEVGSRGEAKGWGRGSETLRSVRSETPTGDTGQRRVSDPCRQRESLIRPTTVRVRLPRSSLRLFRPDVFIPVSPEENSGFPGVDFFPDDEERCVSFM